MSINANPSINPANNDSLTGVLQHVFNKLMQGIDGAIPARVIACDNSVKPPVVQVQPMIKLLNTNNAPISRAQIAAVPVAMIGAGGFFISFPVKPGDQGLLFAMDRDISLYLQKQEESPPYELRMKSFADAYFLPLVLSGYTVAGEDVANLIIQTLNGDVKITLADNKIKIAAPTVEIVTETLNVNASTAVNITSPEINLNASTNIIATTPLVAASVNITAGGSITPGTPPP